MWQSGRRGTKNLEARGEKFHRRQSGYLWWAKAGPVLYLCFGGATVFFSRFFFQLVTMAVVFGFFTVTYIFLNGKFAAKYQFNTVQHRWDK